MKPNDGAKQDQKVEQFYIYESKSEFDVTIRSQRKEWAASGKDFIVIPKVSCPFNNRVFHLTEAFCEEKQISMEMAKKLLESTPNYRQGEIKLLYDSSQGGPIPPMPEKKKLGITDGPIDLASAATRVIHG